MFVLCSIIFVLTVYSQDTNNFYVQVTSYSQPCVHILVAAAAIIFDTEFQKLILLCCTSSANFSTRFSNFRTIQFILCSSKICLLNPFLN